MYAGHFAAGFAIKARAPKVPTWAILLGVGFLDVLFGVFVPLGIERASITPGVSPGFRLDFIDWSHSLAMSLVWSAIFGGVFYAWKKDRTIALTTGFAVFSHFLLDLLMHPGDLALWPHSAAHAGFGIWVLLPGMEWWLFELAFILLALGYYFAASRKDPGFGRHATWACAVVLALHAANAPFLHLAG
jgi:hypothetical protein